ncbi:MAG: hypothetical protein Q8P04_00200 [bacterium]|nr:hypothetical protein [bacterium]
MLCGFGRHKWEQIPEVWEADTPWLKANAQCQRCLVRGEINWTTKEMAKEELREVARELRESFCPPSDSVG